MQVEQVDFVSVPTRDIERAVACYRDVLGLPQTRVHRGRGRGAERHALLLGAREARRRRSQPNEAGIALRVADVAAARAELEAKGVEFVGETYDSGVCHMAFFEDPDGNVAHPAPEVCALVSRR